MSEDELFMPKVVILPQAQAEIDASPVLQKALGGLKETLLNAMQGVKDGRYKSFDDAIEAMTGERPEAVQPPNPPRFGYYLTVGPHPRGLAGLLAVISDGTPQKGHSPVTVMDMKVVANLEEAEAWFTQRCPMLGWQTDKTGADEDHLV